MKSPLGVSPSRPSPSPTGGGGRDERSGADVEGGRPPSAFGRSGSSCSSGGLGGAADSQAAAPLTPAGYHRGQNPSGGVDVAELPARSSVMSLEIMELILCSDEPGRIVHDEVGLDGITLTSKEDGHDAACHVLADHGFIISPRDSGLKWYRHAYDIEGGGVVGWDYRGQGQSWIVELPGEQWMRDHERCRAATFELSLALPMRCTRLDIRRDQYGRGLTLIDNIGDACMVGQLRRVKQFRPMDEHPARSPSKHLARGWYLGSTRSERFVRAYDKGLERGLSTPAWWERCEAEIRKDLADMSWRAIVAAGDEWVLAALEHLVGVVDFRVNATRHATLAELDRPAWWSEFCLGRDGVRPAIQRPPTDAAGFLHWIGRTVLPTIESVRERLGLSQRHEVWSLLEAENPLISAGGSELVVRDLVAQLR